MERRELEEVVRQVLLEMARPSEDGPTHSSVRNYTQANPNPSSCPPAPNRAQVPNLQAQSLQRETPARIVQGRVGTRYLTSSYIQLRAEHAIALDAVHSAVDPAFVKKLGCIEVRSQCKDHEEFLLQPDLGRRLNAESRQKLQQEGTKGADVQVICADGLSAWAIQLHGEVLLPALQKNLTAAGLSVGKPIFAHLARVGLQDDVGVLLGNKATVILVGERPGLGTGDSLSIYTAFAPKLNQDNAEKDCISNIRAKGILPLEAATLCTDLLKRTFAAGGGGVHLTNAARNSR